MKECFCLFNTADFIIVADVINVSDLVQVSDLLNAVSIVRKYQRVFQMSSSSHNSSMGKMPTAPACGRSLTAYHSVANTDLGIKDPVQ